LIKTVHPNLSKLLTFVDLNDYDLGRLKSEYKRELKLNKLESV
jgi:hypothetical protein